MKIVIDIDEEDWKDINDIHFIREDLKFKIGKAIMKGTPLPEHHGRIVDESQIKHIVCHTERELYEDKICYVKATDAPTIIEAEETKKEYIRFDRFLSDEEIEAERSRYRRVILEGE